MGDNTGVSWCHYTQNFWVGCDKCSPECAHCYIERTLRRQGRDSYGKLCLTKTWDDPFKWEQETSREDTPLLHEKKAAKRVFTCSLSDFFHQEADQWRPDAWAIIKTTPHLVWLVLTKRAERIEKHLPADWGDGYDRRRSAL